MIDGPGGTKLTLYRSWIKMQFQPSSRFLLAILPELQRLFLKHTIQGSKLNTLTNEH